MSETPQINGSKVPSQSEGSDDVPRRPDVVSGGPIESIGHNKQPTIGEVFHESSEGLAIDPGKGRGKTLGVFTSGGDSGGMNSAVRTVVGIALYLGFKVYLIYEGYQGMVDDGKEEPDGSKLKYIKEARWDDVSGIIHMGGTNIGTARSEEFRKHEGRLKAAENLVRYGITYLVVIGGDGSLTGANLFRNKWAELLDDLVKGNRITEEQKKKNSHLHIVGMVGSIDNDFCGTDMTIGADSALHRIVESVNNITTTAASHKRTFIIEVMGRLSGYLANVGAISTQADWVFTPEDPPAPGWEKNLCKKLDQRRDMGQRFNIILVAEGARDANSKKIKVEDVKKAVVEIGKYDARTIVLAHVQRGGTPSAFDRILGIRMGFKAVAALLQSTPDSESSVVCLDGNKEVCVSLEKYVAKTQSVATAMNEKKFSKAQELRGCSSQRHFQTFKRLKELMPPKASLESPNRGYRVAVVCCGDPCCGMNPALQSFVRNMIFLGHHVFAFLNGIDGLMEGKIIPLKWEDVHGLMDQRGSYIGTRRTLAGTGNNMQRVVDRLREHNIQGLLVIGGFEAYQCVMQMAEARVQHSELRIPLCVVPATISNNVPGTDFAIGADSALNEVMRMSDQKLVGKLAKGTEKEVSVCETMGGFCGHFPTMSALVGAADAAYIHEEKFDDKDLIADAKHMKEKMRRGAQRGLILMNANEKKNYIRDIVTRIFNIIFNNKKANYDRDVITRIFSEEGKGTFSCPDENFGRMQQGLSPSPFDRIIGTTMSEEAANWMLSQLKIHCPDPKGMPDCSTSDSACLVGLGRGYKLTPVETLKKETDFKYQRPFNQWFMELRPILRILSTVPHPEQA